MNKEKIRQAKLNKYVLIVNKVGLLKYYFCDDKTQIDTFIKCRKLKDDEYILLTNENRG